MHGHAASITGIDILFDKVTVVSASLDSTIRFWDLAQVGSLYELIMPFYL